jgi:hypothetical protein
MLVVTTTRHERSKRKCTRADKPLETRGNALVVCPLLRLADFPFKALDLFYMNPQIPG